MITGYNTDVEHEGVVYHVQTEDKGTGMPVILSLVYVGGAILVSKRSSYDDLMTAGFDEGVLATRLQRQHKLICAAIHSGRIEDLKRLSRAEPVERPKPGEEQKPFEQTPPAEIREAEPVAVPVPEADHSLYVTILDDCELRAGESVTMRVYVSRGSGAWERAVPGARVVLKTLGSTFRPAITVARTNRSGVASIPLSLPSFKTGRAAVLVRVENQGEIAELRRVVLPQ